MCVQIKMWYFVDIWNKLPSFKNGVVLFLFIKDQYLIFSNNLIKIMIPRSDWDKSLGLGGMTLEEELGENRGYFHIVHSLP